MGFGGERRKEVSTAVLTVHVSQAVPTLGDGTCALEMWFRVSRTSSVVGRLET